MTQNLKNQLIRAVTAAAVGALVTFLTKLLAALGGIDLNAVDLTAGMTAASVAHFKVALTKFV